MIATFHQILNYQGYPQSPVVAAYQDLASISEYKLESHVGMSVSAILSQLVLEMGSGERGVVSGSVPYSLLPTPYSPTTQYGN